MADFDLAIIGGGINGAGIARDAAGRGLSVLLIEQNLDFAFAMAQRGYVMEKGQIVLEAPIADLRHDAVERVEAGTAGEDDRVDPVAGDAGAGAVVGDGPGDGDDRSVGGRRQVRWGGEW